MRLSSRELLIVTVGALLLVIGGFWALVIDPVNENLSLLDRKLLYQQERFERIQTLSSTFSDLKQTLSNAENNLKRSKEFSILSHLENLASKQGLKTNIVQMKPKQGVNSKYYKESLVEIKMEKIDLQQLVRYLHQVENGPELLRIKELRMKPRFDDPNMVDSLLEISAYQIADNSQN